MMLFRIIILTILIFSVFSEIVHIEQGNLNGTFLYSRGGKRFHAFYGIPYAAPPIGMLRFAVSA